MSKNVSDSVLSPLTSYLWVWGKNFTCVDAAFDGRVLKMEFKLGSQSVRTVARGNIVEGKGHSQQVQLRQPRFQTREMTWRYPVLLTEETALLISEKPEGSVQGAAVCWCHVTCQAE